MTSFHEIFTKPSEVSFCVCVTLTCDDVWSF